MINLFLIINYTLISISFLSFLYLDLKHREVPIRFFKFSYILGIVVNFFEFLLFFDFIVIIIFLKIFILIFVFSLSLLLFILKIIGGAEGKLFIFIFFVHPILLLNLTVIFSFFLVFSSFFVFFFIAHLMFNKVFGDSFSFILFFNLNLKLSILKKTYLRSFYKFFDYSDLSDYIEKKYLIKSLNLIYNFKKNKFQILCQIRPPLIMFVILSYYIVFFLK